MTAAVEPAPSAVRRSRPSPLSRIYGLGSVYAKTLRDSRLAFIIMAGLTSGLMLVVGAALGKDIADPGARRDLVHLVESMPPIIAGLAGTPINIGTLGGYLSWKYGPFFAIMAGTWSILALSGTLAAEARRGSLDFVAAAPFGKRRVALEKLAAHVTVMALVVVLLAISSWLAGELFGSIPEDAISPAMAVDFALLVGLIGLASGSVAFALGPIVGRGSAAGIAGVVMMLGYLVNAYKVSVPAFEPLAGLTWFGWSAANVPLAGQLDWLSLVPVAVAAVVFFAIGAEAFDRRDLGVTTPIRWPSMPAALLGVGGPVMRAFGERLPLAFGWGVGVGFLGFIMGAAARSMADAFASMSPATLEFFWAMFPGYDLGSAGSLLDLVFISFGFIFAGFAAATLVAGWASDEGSGRLEMLLTTPLARARWAISGGVGVFGAIAVMTAVFAAGIALGAAITGGDVVTPTVGTVVLGLYAVALAGIGLAVGGLFRTSIAAEVVAALVIITFLIDLVVPALGLPDWVHQLALTAHLGRPMIGVWDWGGMATGLVLAIGGLALAGWGMTRRDVRG
jgi:ABC-2 type transport system permease protein